MLVGGFKSITDREANLTGTRFCKSYESLDSFGISKARMVQDRGKLVQRLDAGYFLKAPVWWDVDGMKNAHR